MKDLKTERIIFKNVSHKQWKIFHKMLGYGTNGTRIFTQEDGNWEVKGDGKLIKI